MRIRHLVLGACFAAVCTPPVAGAASLCPATPLPTAPCYFVGPLRETGTLRVVGKNNSATDGLKIPDGVQTGTDFAPPSTFTQLEARQSNIIYQGNKVGTLYDFVFRDTTDNQLVFGSRIVLDPLVNGQINIFEVNDFYRSGNTGFTDAVAWSFGSTIDLRMYSAARTAKDLLGGADTFDPDILNTRSDINVSEGNGRSGYHFIKSNAPFYRLRTVTGTCGTGTYTYGFRIRQSGEEQQPKADICFDSFVPSSTPPAVPTESVPVPPWALVLLAAALALVGLRARHA